MNELAHYITDYGYWALFIGCLAEGETITMLGGMAAHEGLLQLPWVLAVVALGGTLGDQLLYFAGRRFGGKAIARLKSQQQRIERAQKLIARHPMLFVIGVRFMYGFRIIGPVLIGASRLPPSRFIPLNLLGALLWATIFVLIGYFGGQAMEGFLAGIDKKFSALLLVVVAVALIWLLRYWWRRRHANE
ncbi:DedA family protein [Serratia odorifera]|jgi:membrane protein DedA with SNARE-associated domain|uniref:SNARE-like domain protein n=2 Tax=Serratia odorifera TaxID=618 RepID=D4E9C1_SEROD|nr:DedA family protein [Serratia odorifera]EFE93887.1 SNARE-like domain protein [Serratia odorifera DSM 4582]MBJ2064226.1 DedA family protein [Serratia odorifera]PNK88520.1 DedA family protein [Serratia odorifera]RII69685.1 DedA family protein [Serratia odorifera]VDZ65639.1 Inner membrane protein yohD [Serratia odorifera]